MEHLTWRDAKRIVLIADRMLDQEALDIIKWRGEQAYYEEMLRRVKDSKTICDGKREGDDPRDKKILQAIRASLANIFGVTYADLMTGWRKREIVEMRYLVFSVVRHFSNSTDGDFARLFPAFDRVSINYHALHRAKELMEIDSKYAEKYARLKEAVEEELKKQGVIC